MRSTRRSTPGAPRLLLDNMTPDEMRAIVAEVAGRAELEASGGIDLDTVRAAADDGGRLHLGRSAHALRPRPRPLPHPGAVAMNLPMAPSPSTPEALTARRDHRADRRGPRAGRASATRSSSPTTTRCPRSRTSPTTSATRWALSRQAAAADADVIAFCGVHFMAETASILSPEKTVLIPDLDAGCSLADSITARAAAGLAGQAPRRGHRHVRQHDGRDQGADRLLRDVVQRRQGRRAHPTASTARTPRSSSAPTCCSAPTSRRRSAARMHVWDGECHVHAGIRPADITDDARRAPGRRLPHPPRVRLLDLGHGVRRRRRRRRRGRAHALDRRDARLRARARGRRAATAIVATETGMLHPLRDGRARRRLRRRQRARELPLHEDDHAAEAARRLRDLSRRGQGRPALAERARLPIERMVAIG